MSGATGAGGQTGAEGTGQECEPWGRNRTFAGDTRDGSRPVDLPRDGLFPGLDLAARFFLNGGVEVPAGGDDDGGTDLLGAVA